MKILRKGNHAPVKAKRQAAHMDSFPFWKLTSGPNHLLQYFITAFKSQTVSYECEHHMRNASARSSRAIPEVDELVMGENTLRLLHQLTAPSDYCRYGLLMPRVRQVGRRKA
jgi:hypothetical protein